MAAGGFGGALGRSRRSPAVAGDAYPTRRAGLLADQREERVVIRGRRSAGVRVNQTAALLWRLSDGRERADDIAVRLAALYPNRAETIGADVREGLAALEARGLIGVSDEPAPARPLLAVAFTGFWRGFNPADNYFVWMLTHRFDPIVVDPCREVPTLLFYSSFLPQTVDRRAVDRSRTWTVCCALGLAADVEGCDYILAVGDQSPAGAHQTLPLWSLHVDWSRYVRSAAAVREHRVAAAFQPANVCNRLVDFLLAAEDTPDAPSRRTGAGAAQLPALASTGPPEVRAGAIVRPRSTKLTIGMATFDDYDGVYFTVQAIRLFHPEVTAETEILVVDNNPDGAGAQPLRDLAHWVDGYRYAANAQTQGTATRDLVFREARSPAVLCVDSHVLLAPGAIRQLIDFLDVRPDCADLLQGPLVLDDLQTARTHFAPVWSNGMYGVWASDPRGARAGGEPFEIPMQGLGAFACRRDAWLGFNPRFVGFGGEEGYIHEKFRRAGARTLCLPFLRWAHRFQRPFGIPYRNAWEQRVRNYLIGWHELGMDLAPVETHFGELLGADAFESVVAPIRAEMESAFFHFDAIYCINLDAAADRWQRMTERFARLGILHRVRRFSAVETPESHHIGCALSHRRIVDYARHCGFRNVLVFEDDALFLDDCPPALRRSIDELRARPWLIFHLGGHRWGRQFSTAPGCAFLEGPCRELTTTHAVAYHADVYERLLAELPADVDAMRQWIAARHGIDQYLRTIEPRFVSRPPVSLQQQLLAENAPDLADRFS